LSGGRARTELPAMAPPPALQKVRSETPSQPPPHLGILEANFPEPGLVSTLQEDLETQKFFWCRNKHISGDSREIKTCLLTTYSPSPLKLIFSRGPAISYTL